MTGVNLWMLVFVALTQTGEVETHVVDFFGDMDSCFATADEIVSKTDESQPWNWDFVCLEYNGRGI